MGLKDIAFPFNPSSEEEVRVALASYFQELGFSSSEMSFEDYFTIKLGHTNIEIRKQGNILDKQQEFTGGRSDMLLTVQGHPFAIVEIKALAITLTDQDRDQGLSYARLLLKMPPFTILTNGEELRIYDTITTNLLNSGTPEFARDWKTRITSPVDENLQKQATRTLLSLNFEVLQKYCRKQIERELSDLKGSLEEGKRYLPDLYVPRKDTKDILGDFLASDYLCLAFIGDSGIGKTNIMCALAEAIKDSDHQIALFYQGINLKDGLKAAIENDFEWEFERHDIQSRIITRFAELARKHQTQLILFIDGLDEYPEELKIIKSELVDLAKRLSPDTIRLCLSCKTTDWSGFVLDRGESLNSLGTKIFTCDSSKLSNTLPGVWLNLFTDNELNLAWDKYKQAFNLEGDLRGETQQESKMPLFLRFVGEVYKNQHSPIPTNLTDMKIFDHYWVRKMGDFNDQEKLILEKLVCKAAEEMIFKDSAILEEKSFFDILDSSLANSPLYEDSFRFRFLIRQNRDGNNYIVFPFEKLRSYIYCMKARRWLTITDAQKAKGETLLILDKRLGQDALIFYLDIINGRVNNEWLTYIIECDLNLFLKIIRKFERWKLQNAPAFTAFEPYRNNQWLENLDKAYIKLLNCFSAIKDRLEIDSQSRIGIFIYTQSKEFFSYGFRTINAQYPQQLLEISKEGYEYWDNIATRESFVNCIGADGEMTEVYGNDPFLNDPLLKYPETAAWKRISKKIAALSNQQLLNEHNNPHILAERIYRILRFEPFCWTSDRLPRGYFWELLGFTSIEEITTESCTEIIERVRNLYNQFSACSQSQDNNTIEQRWYKLESESLLSLLWFIHQFQQSSQNLPSIPQIELLIEGLHFDDETFLQRIPEITNYLAPIVIESFALLAKVNMPNILDFTIFSNTNGRIILEIACPDISDFESSTSGIQRRVAQNPEAFDDGFIDGGHYIYISYIWLPSAPTGNSIIKTVRWEDSIAERFIINRKSFGNIFAKNVEVETYIDDISVIERHAVISRVRYESFSIANQVYQLFMNEAGCLLGNQGYAQLNSLNKTELLGQIKHFGIILLLLGS